MAGLPDSYHCTVSLDLIDVTTFHPNVLSRVHRRRNDRRGDDSRSSYNRRRRNDSRNGRSNNPVGHNTANYAADKTRPEIPAAASPGATMTMTMNWTMVMMTDDTAMSATMIMTAMTSCECRSRAKRDCDTNCCDFNHFIHIAPSLSPHLAVTVR